MALDLYTLDSLQEYVSERYGKEIAAQTANSREDRKKSYQRDRILKYDRDCYSGDPNDKRFVKSYMLRIMTDCEGLPEKGFPVGYGVNVDTVDKFIDWKRKDNDAYLKFLGMLLFYKTNLGFGQEAFGKFVENHALNRLRPDTDGKSIGFFITRDDIDAAWDKENIQMTYEMKVELLTQLMYEEIKGNSCIDELTYQNVGDISIGVSGIPDTLFSEQSGDYSRAYDTCWVKYLGCSIHLRFLTFGSYEKMKDVVRRGVAYEMKGQFSEKEGFKLGYAKDGSRRSAAIEPFGESPALWIRKFTVKHETNANLFGGLPSSQKVEDVERILVQGGATIPVCGPQGSGKTTKLEAICEYIQGFYAIRVIESEFETRLRWKYPQKNIFAVEANENTPVSPAEAYNFSLRTAGDVYIIGEARGDDSIVNVTRTANRGGRSVLFTFHPNSPKATITEIANALIREKMYTNLKDAIATALETVHCCIYVKMDLEAQCRYYEIYEFVPRLNGLPSDFMNVSDPKEREAKFMETMYRYMQHMVTADIFYEAVPLIRFNRDLGEYQYLNTVSDPFYDELKEKTPLEAERNLLERTFRPAHALYKALHKEASGKTSISQPEFERACREYQINSDLLSYDGFLTFCKAREAGG